jgi:hypothetical protein
MANWLELEREHSTVFLLYGNEKSDTKNNPVRKVTLSASALASF